MSLKFWPKNFYDVADLNKNQKLKFSPSILKISLS